MYLGNSAAKRRVLLHFGDVIKKEKELAVTGTRDHYHFFAAFKIGVEACVEDILFTAHFLSVRLPALTIWRIGKHEIKLAGRMLIQGKRGTKADVFGLIAIALQEHICGANSVGSGCALYCHDQPSPHEAKRR